MMIEKWNEFMRAASVVFNIAAESGWNLANLPREEARKLVFQKER